ncbi:MAG: VPDSG-CTERM sorting domain-containing protein [Verrucomicrobiales bacterium]|nr:VPDSG-CTERM sorting domain-containing protein [Verrucomicrobiales bacterium]
MISRDLTLQRTLPKLLALALGLGGGYAALAVGTPIKVINDQSKLATVNISYNSGASYANSLAGAIKMDVNQSGGGGIYAGDPEIFWTYCLDVAPSLYLGTTYHFEAKPFPDPKDPPPAPGWVVGGIYRAAYLFNTEHDLWDAVPPADKKHAAALQLAIWECLYDTELNLTAGTFQVGTSTDNDIELYAQQYLNAVSDAIADNSFVIYTTTWLDPDENTQSLLYRPVPDGGSTLAMLGLGFLGMAGLMRRNRN